jgi:nucleotide-binding universal stress UspA family protein
MLIKEILVPTDFSKSSDLAVAYAYDVARRYGARLHLLHVIYDIEKSAGWYMSQIDTGALYDEMHKRAQEEIDRQARDLLGGCDSCEGVILRGIPYEEILSFARDRAIDLIVIGTHGRTGIDRVLFGSTAAKVVRYAHMAVLIVREPGPTPE